MTKAIITIGIPASGKTTWARQYVRENENAIIVSRDDIRLAHGWKSGPNEVRVTKIHRAQMEAAFIDGMDVVVADTNINPKFRRQLIKFCHEHGVDVETKVFHVSMDEAIRRDLARENKVGPDVIAKFVQDLSGQQLQDEALPHPQYTPYRHTTGDNWKRHAILVDIDGTVARMVSRGPFEEHKVSTDEPIDDVISVIQALDEFFDIVFVSGRSEACRADTEAWITDHIGFEDITLFMRPLKDQRPDYVIKAEIYDRDVIPKWNVTMVFDDRDQVVRHVRKRGITVAQVAPGRF